MKEKVAPFYAYHGTTKTAGENICKTKTFKPGKLRDDHWLGQGSYFFREDYKQALLWAVNKIKKVPELNHETPCVVEAVINVNPRNFLNLDSRSGLERFKWYLEVLRANGMGIRIENSLEKSQAQIRCYLMSLLPKDVWVVQRTFPVQSKFDNIKEFSQMGLHLHGVQVCVRNPLAIQSNTISMV